MPQWENAAALWLGLTIPAIVLLWVLRPRRPRLRVPSLLLWPGSSAERQSAKPWQRLRNHPLLWLQLAAAVLLCLAAARPFLPASASARLLVVLLDASGSMRATDVSPDRFSAARQFVLNLARELGPGQAMTVIRVDERPQVLVAGATSLAPVEVSLSSQAPSFGPADGTTAVSLASGLTTGPAEWILVSDGGLSLPEGARRPAGTSLRMVPIGQAAANVAITGLALRQGPGGVTLQAGLRHTGLVPASGHLQLLAEGQLVGDREWHLEPGGETYLAWANLPEGPRWFEARLSALSAQANALEHDDRAWAASPAASEAAVLLVSPGSTFLEQALSVHPDLRAFRVHPADWSQMAAASQAYPLTVFDRLWPEEMPDGSVLLVGPPTGEEFHPREVWPRPQHPLLNHVDWSEVRVATVRKLPLDSNWETVIDSDGGPLLAIRTEGGRRQAAIAFDLSQTDLPLRPAFPVLMANLLAWLLPAPEAEPRAVPPGASVAIDPAPLAQQVWAEGPEGDRYDLAPPWPPLSFQPPRPGLYRIVQAGEGDRQEFAVVVDGYHPSEADLVPRPLGLPPADGEPVAPAHGTFAYWPWLALAILGLSLGEWWLDARGG